MATDHNFNIFVSLTDDSSSPSSGEFRIDLQVELSYHSSDPTVGRALFIPEASRSRSFRFPFLSPTLIPGLLSDGSVVPFPLERLLWIDPRDGAATPLEDVVALARRVASEAAAAEGAVVLRIAKKVVVGEGEWEAMEAARAEEERARWREFCLEWMATQLGVSREWIGGRFEKEAAAGMRMDDWLLRSMAEMATGELERRWAGSLLAEEMAKATLNPS